MTPSIIKKPPINLYESGTVSKKINDRSITKTASNGVIAVVLETSTNFMA